MPDTDVLVVGAGPAGLAVAACLRTRGIDTIVLDRGSALGESWRTRYERLHLHSPRIQSSLPGLPIPARFGRWVAKNDMADYVRHYADHHAIVPRFRTEVRRVDRGAGSWRAETDDGPVSARQLVIATGYSHSPVQVHWDGRESFAGDVIHASNYRSPAPYVGKNVLVVGAGNTGAEIAADLAENGAARVWLAIRTPPNIIPRQVGPVPTTLLAIGMEYSPAWLVDPVNRLLQRWVLGDLTRYGMPVARSGVIAQARATGVIPTIDVGLVASLRAGRVMPVAAVERFDGEHVALVDGSHIVPDAVIAATGYTTGLAPLVGHLGVLDARGKPRITGRRSLPHTPGLRFVGLSNPLKGHLFQIKLDARSVARAIAADLKTAT